MLSVAVVDEWPGDAMTLAIWVLALAAAILGAYAAFAPWCERRADRRRLDARLDSEFGRGVAECDDAA